MIYPDDFINKVIYGDCLEMMKEIPDKSIDLIYCDPPFFTNKNYKYFKDCWAGGINVYIEWMKERVVKMHDILKDTGSFYLHCDWHAGHYLKIMLDEVFGYHCFQNDIAWCYRQGGRSERNFPRKHDTIFFYTKGKEWIFNPDPIRVPYHGTGGYVSKGRNIVGGKEYRLNPLGKIPEDWWDIPALTPTDKERLGYPTQKPEALLERIIKASSNKNDIVLDPFCGCGTTMSVAHRLNRKWIGIDISPTAISLVEKRLKQTNQQMELRI